MDIDDIKAEFQRIAFGGVALFLLGLTIKDVYNYFQGSVYFKTIWQVIAGKNVMVTHSMRWQYGLFELCPGGELAAILWIMMLLCMLLGSIFNLRFLYYCAGSIFIGCYLINAVFLVKLLSNY